MTTIYSSDGTTVTRRYRDSPRWHWQAESAISGRFVPADTATGYFPLVETVRPAATDTTTHDYSVVRAGEAFVETWTAREFTADEVAARTATTNETTIRTAAAQALDANRDFLALGTPTSAQVVAQVRALTRQCQALIRLQLGDLSGTD